MTIHLIKKDMKSYRGVDVKLHAFLISETDKRWIARSGCPPDSRLGGSQTVWR